MSTKSDQPHKERLRDYGRFLAAKVNAAFGRTLIADVSARYQGIYQWTINFCSPGESESPVFQLKFGPSAWHANENDEHWKMTVPRTEADYSHLFITCSREVRQSVVTMREALEGIQPEDDRLLKEIVSFINPRSDPRE